MQIKIAFAAVATFIMFQRATAQWSTSGNNITTAYFLGTKNNVSLRVRTNNLQRFIIDSVGRVGIGIALPGQLFTVKGAGTDPSAAWVSTGVPLIAAYGETTAGNADQILAISSETAGARPVFVGKRARGTLAVPAAVVKSDYLFSLRSSGYDGTAFQEPAAIDFYADAAPAAGRVPASISFATGSNSANRLERLKISSSGDVSVNTGNLSLLTGRQTIKFGTPVVGGPAMITMFPSGSQNPTRMVIAHSKAYPGWGLQYNDTTDQFDFVAYGVSGLNINPYSGNIIVKNSVIAPFIAASATAASSLITSYNYGAGNGIYGYTAGGNSADPNGLSGVYGYNAGIGYGVGGYGTTGSGLYGYSPNYTGVWGSTGNSSYYAGYFQGNVYSTGTFTSSDRKLKKDVADMTSGMDIISQLKPKTYEFRQDGNYKLMNLPAGKQYGLIAQDLEKVLPNLVKQSEFDPNMVKNLQIPAPAVKLPNNTDPQVNSAAAKIAAATPTAAVREEKIDFKAINYTELIPIIIKGMQEQQALIEEQNKKIAALTELVEKLSAGPKSGLATEELTSATLDQNVPNPASNATTIKYYLPKAVKTAQLLVTDSKGAVIKTIVLNSRNAGQVTLSVNTLESGSYYYTLIADGRKIATKQMQMIK